ncbi:hypothetical protein F2P56_002593 [Juglans regia]|uniref:Uncharacterized protein n=2 Tax=Juglans regia TaxID=51240 RepID=A0A833Y9B5_JUGRE|nr:uncharacterized protein LOC108986412 [Juglans regia]KAF5481988.1 hypothetical protein F2P56_002593 [Juglans regia]
MCKFPWQLLFRNSSVNTAAASSSDHSPLVVLISTVEQLATRVEKPFRYEASWAVKEECKKVIEESWNRNKMMSNKLMVARENLKRSREKLSWWSKNSVQPDTKIIHNRFQKLQALQKANKGDLKEEIQATKKEINQLLEEEDTYWRQRAKHKWLLEGDRNTRLFH